MRKIYLIRHAESEANIGKFFSDPAAIPITDKGLQQAVELASKISNVTKLYHSKYIRTLQTAKATIDKLNLNNVEVHPDIHEFTYLHPEQFMNPGLSDEDKRQLIENYWLELNPNFKDSDSVESFAEFTSRAIAFINDAKTFDHDTYVFSHSNFMRGVLIILNKFPEFIEGTFSDARLKEFMQEFKDDRINPIENTGIVEIGQYLD